MSYDGPHKVLNVGSGRGLSVNQIIAELEVAFGRDRLPCIHKPSRAADVPANVLDTALIRSELDWQPRVALREGLISTIAWMRAISPRSERALRRRTPPVRDEAPVTAVAADGGTAPVRRS